MKKMMVLLLTVALVLSAFAVPAVLAAETPSNVALASGGSKDGTEWLDDDQQVGIRFTVTGAGMDAFVVKEVPTYGESNTRKQSFLLYQWDTDYATTIAGEKLYEVASIVIPTDGCDMTYTFDSTMPAGEYLAVVTNLTENAGSCVYRYVNGTPADGVSFYYRGEATTNVYYSEYVPAAEALPTNSSVEMEDKVMTIENGVESSLTWGVQDDAAASGGKMQGISPGYSYIFENISAADKIEVLSCSHHELTLTFSYSTDDGATWVECGSGDLTPNGVWNGAYGTDVITLTKSIPAGASLKVDSDASGTEPYRGANVDKLVFLANEDNTDTADSSIAVLMVMMAVAVVALPVLRKREAL